MKFNQNSFTYGVEVEGYFTNSLISKLEDNVNLIKKTDGSVHLEIDDIKCNKNDIARIENESSSFVSEINIGVFYQFKKLIECLKMIDEKNHFENESCGLHLHIKPKTKFSDYRGIVGDFNFIDKLQKFGFNKLCKCVKIRKGNDYCLIYTADDIRRKWNSRNKYQFVRNHPTGTFEFRFLAPCKHKVENIKKFLTYFLIELNKVDSRINKVVELNQYLPEKVLYNYSLEKENEKTKYQKYQIEDVLKIERGETHSDRMYRVQRAQQNIRIRRRGMIMGNYEALLRQIRGGNVSF